MEQVLVIRNLTTGQYWNGIHFTNGYIWNCIDKEYAMQTLNSIKPIGNYMIEPIYVR